MSKTIPHFHTGKPLSKKQPVLGDVYSIGLKAAILASNKWFRRASLVFSFTSISFGYGYTTYGRIMANDHSSNVILVIDYVSHFLMTLSNLSGCVMMLQYEKYQPLFFQLINYIASKTVSKTFFGIITNVFTILGLLSFGLNAFTLTSMLGWGTYKYCIFKDMQFNLVNLTTSSFSELTYSLKGMYGDINQELLSVYENIMKPSQVTSNIEGIDIFAATSTGNLRPNEMKIKVIHLHKTPKCLSVLKKITKNHNEISQFMDDFNTLLGPMVFATVASIVFNIIWALTIIIDYDIREVVLKGRYKLTTTVLISQIFANLLWIFIMVGQTILLGVIGRSLTVEGRNTSTICYKMLGQQAFREEDEEAMLVKRQLTILAKQAETRCPVLTAGGFFSVNLSILGLVASNVIAYTIVAIQFILNEH